MGGPTLGFGLLKWGEDGWPYLSFDFVDDGVYSVLNSNSNMAMGMWTHPVTKTTALYQLSKDSTDASQKWLFKSSGTGEYTIQNYEDNAIYLEAGGTDNSQTVDQTTSYDAKINQKFRLVKGSNDRVIIYPSTKDNIFTVPYDATIKYRISLLANDNKAGQRWSFQPYDVTFSVSGSNENLSYRDTTFNDIATTGNSLWDVTFDNDSWLQVNPQSGEGDTILSVHAQVNTTGSVRRNKIFIHSHGRKTETLIVTQAANPGTTASIDQRRAAQIKIYPNPTTGKVYIEVAKKATVRIYNNVGTELISKEISTSKSTIDISNLIPGMYIFSIEMEESRINRMVLKK